MDNRGDYKNDHGKYEKVADDSECLYKEETYDDEYSSDSTSDYEYDDRSEYDNGLSEKEMIEILEQQFSEQFGKIVNNIQIKNVCVDTEKIRKRVKQTLIYVMLTINGVPYDIDSEILFISDGLDYSKSDIETTYSDPDRLMKALNIEYKEKMNNIMYEMFEMIM